MANKRKDVRRVGMLSHSYYLMDGRVRREAECLAKQGVEVHVVSIRGPKQNGILPEPSHEIVNAVHIHRLPIRKARGSKLRYFYEYTAMTILGAWKLLILNMEKRFDVIHIHNMPDILVIAGIIPKLTGAVLLLDVHDPMSEMFQAKYNLPESHLLIRLLKVQEWISYRLADHLLTVSVPMAENVAKKRGCPAKAVGVAHNFPDGSRFPTRDERNGWPYNNKDEIVFLYAGLVSEHYRLDIAVRALAEASRSIPHIKLWILGGGNRLQELLNLARDLGVAEKVEHLKPVPQDKVTDIMMKADVGITTHQAGTFGDLYFSTKIIEYMTQGLPVLSSRTKTIEKYIPEDAIFYFEAGNVEDLVRKMVSMWKNPALVSRKIENSKKVVSGYNWEEEQKKILALYQELLKS